MFKMITALKLIVQFGYQLTRLTIAVTAVVLLTIGMLFGGSK